MNLGKFQFILKPMLLTSILGALIACSEPEMKPYEVLGELRILALKADFPEVNPSSGASTNVTITPLLSDINNSGSLTYSAAACIDLGVSLGGDPTCVGNSTIVTIATDQPVTTLNSTNSYTGAANTFVVAVPASEIIFANRSSQSQFNGIGYLVTYTLNSSDGRSVKSFRRLTASTRSPLNQNPSLSDILVNSSSFSFPFASSVSLSPNFALGAESYQEIRSDGTLKASTESLLTTWFVSDGKLKSYRSVAADSVTYEAPSASPSGRKAILIAITRDGRGGLDYLLKTSP